MPKHLLTKSTTTIPDDILMNKIYQFRGMQVMLDSDLATMYEVEVKRLNEAVRRNMNRFPADFIFQLSPDEWESIRSQIATANPNSSKRRFQPYVFTEQGVAMLSSVLNSDRAIEINIAIMRIFVRIRQWITGHHELLDIIKQLDKKDKDLEVKVLDLMAKVDRLYDDRESKKLGFDVSG